VTHARGSTAVALGLAAWLAGGASAEGELAEVRAGAPVAADGDWEAEVDPFGVLGYVLVALFAPFELPRRAVGDGGGDARFAPYPYRDDRGFWRAVEGGDADGAEWSLRPRWELGSDLDDLERTGLGLELEHARRFGLDAAWSRWVEDVDGGGSDELDLGDANLVYRFAQGERAAFRAGLGVNVLDDSSGTELGINATYAARFLPARPLSAGLELDLGTLGGDGLVHLRAEMGLIVTRFELFATWDHFDVDGEELRSVALGLRAWF
jgi:hypothetical protein